MLYNPTTLKKKTCFSFPHSQEGKYSLLSHRSSSAHSTVYSTSSYHLGHYFAPLAPSFTLNSQQVDLVIGGCLLGVERGPDPHPHCKVGCVAALVRTTSDASVLARHHTFLDIAFLPILT